VEFFEVLERRRSIRNFSDAPVDDKIIERALQAATLAPNSSNVQTWDFYWTSRDGSTHKQLISACLSQGAARTASHLIVVTADYGKWRRSRPQILAWVDQSIQQAAPKKPNFPPSMRDYYEKLIPLMYINAFGLLGGLRWIGLRLVSLFRPIMIRPAGRRDLQEVAVKSAALACENFVLAITAQGAGTCMMEGFDESRVRRALKLRRSQRVVMVIAVGHPTERGRWGERFRIPLAEVVHRVED